MTDDTKKFGYELSVMIIELSLAETKEDVMHWYNEILQNAWKLYQTKMKECEE